jgi:benzoate/toluate 1,2-dioxygenase reductase subunit
MGMKYIARLSDKYYLSENKKFLFLKFELVEPNELTFVAGQYVSLKVSEKGERRSYSIASAPDNTHGFNLLAEIVEGGLGSNYLQKLEPGDEVDVVGPLGKFVVGEIESPNKKLFVATGSGIVPIWSMINDLLINKKTLTPVRLHWGMKSELDLFWIDDLERLAEAHPNFVYDIVLSRAGEDWELCRGHVQDCLMRDFSLSTGSGLSGWEGYVCGSQEIVKDICQKLEELKINSGNIHHEKFT